MGRCRVAGVPPGPGGATFFCVVPHRMEAMRLKLEKVSTEAKSLQVGRALRVRHGGLRGRESACSVRFGDRHGDWFCGAARAEEGSGRRLRRIQGAIRPLAPWRTLGLVRAGAGC